VKARRKLSEAERRDHQQTLEMLGKIVLAIPNDVPLQREFVLLSA
jgi:hypothetical protein